MYDTYIMYIEYNTYQILIGQSINSQSSTTFNVGVYNIEHYILDFVNTLLDNVIKTIVTF